MPGAITRVTAAAVALVRQIPTRHAENATILRRLHEPNDVEVVAPPVVRNADGHSCDGLAVAGLLQMTHNSRMTEGSVCVLATFDIDDEAVLGDREPELGILLDLQAWT